MGLHNANAADFAVFDFVVLWFGFSWLCLLPVSVLCLVCFVS